MISKKTISFFVFISLSTFDVCTSHSLHLEPLLRSANAVPALKYEFPHFALLGHSESGEVTWFCGGTLITEDTVMTAAHCVKGEKPPNIARFGDLNLGTDDDNQDTQQYEVLSIKEHPNFMSKYNDIALITLKTKVKVTKAVIPACLNNEHSLSMKHSLQASGFGKTDDNGDFSPTLNKIVLSELTKDECKDCCEYWFRRGVLDTHLCAYDKTEHQMDTCEGDSGGPLEMKLAYGKTWVPFIVGVTSFGVGCGTDDPGVYTRISSFIDWLKAEVPEIETNHDECAKRYREFRL